MLELLPPEHNDDLGDIDFTNCVSIHLRDFRRIVHQELSVSYQDRGNPFLSFSFFLRGSPMLTNLGDDRGLGL